MSKKLFLTTDGSKASKVAFFVILINLKQVLEFLDKDVHLTISHISDSTKNYLPYEYKSNTIYNDYHSECLSRVIL